VLIVEPDEDVCEALRAIVLEEGLQPVIAPDAEAALLALRARPPALVLLNTWRDGTAVLAEMRADALCANLPVVTMSTEPQKLAERVAAHFQMPFDLDELCAALHRFSEPRE
jgi:DNA-binding NtrC family response regulator